MMRFRNHGNHRDSNQSRIVFPKFITRCHFSCLSHYAESESSSDLQQESLLENQHQDENEFCHLTGSAWGYYGNSLQNRLDTDAMTTSSDGSTNKEQESENTRPNTSGAFDLQNELNLSGESSADRTPGQSNLLDGHHNRVMCGQQIGGHHFQMPNINRRIWQDGFGRFHHDTIPRRDNAITSPVFSDVDTNHGDMGTAPSSWFINPIMTGLRLASGDLSASLKSLGSTSWSELMDDDDDHDDDNDDDDDDDDANSNGSNSRLGLDGLQDSQEQESHPRWTETTSRNNDSCVFRQTNSSISALCGVSDARSSMTRSQLLLPGHSSSLAELLRSLPQREEDNSYVADNPNGDTFMENFLSGLTVESSQGQGEVQNQGEGHDASHERGRPSLFEVIDQIQQHIQDNSLPSERENNTSRNDVVSPELSTSSSSSTWSNNALIQQLININPHGPASHSSMASTSQGSLASTQSSASNTQHNWYFYDRRLAPDGCAGRQQPVAVIPQPPSYEEASRAVGSDVETNIYSYSRLTVLPDEPPPPYPDSDHSPPPSYTEHEDWSHDHQRLSALGLNRRPPVRWNRSMRPERWATTQNWATEP